MSEQTNIRRNGKGKAYKGDEQECPEDTFLEAIDNELASFKKVMLVPVSATLYVELSNNSSALFWMPLKYNRQLCVPTSAMLTLMRVRCLLLSINEFSIFVKLLFRLLSTLARAEGILLQKIHQSIGHDILR